MEVVYAGSPLQGLTRAPTGALALILGRPGSSTTSLLVHAALSELIAGGRVLHVALDATTEHTRSRYDDLLQLIEPRLESPGLEPPALVVERGRMILSFQGRAFTSDALRQDLQVVRGAVGFAPTLLLIEGRALDDALQQHLESVVALAGELGVRCWAGVRSEALPPPACLAVASSVVRLAADGTRVRLQRVHGPDESEDLPGVFEPSTLLALDGEEASGREPDAQIPPHRCTLYSGGAAGTEATFGEIAARWGMREIAFTFEGHLQQRTEGRHELSPRELEMGDVSLSYVSKRLNRSYNDRGGLIRGVLQTLWHMVSRAQQVFVVGSIQADGTVRGGTGWSVELARMWSRELWVFDQTKERWFRWRDEGWVPESPRITAAHLCGTGTRQINEAGRAAVEALFASSFEDRR